VAWPTTSRHERGYGTAWDRLRKEILKRDKYLCRCDECKKTYRLREATQVDHRISKAQAERMGWTQEQIDHPSNLQAINADCHKRKTDIENGRRIKPRIGADGWPA
jgi:5-methylcytosine-specific restriction enzyme A